MSGANPAHFGPEPDTVCAACLDPFTPEEWDDRHTSAADEDVHSHCCDGCTVEALAEYWRHR